jgi:hypothetical protein
MEEGSHVSDDRVADMAALRATSDQLVLAIHEVDARERRKRGIAPGDPAFLGLARQVRVAAEIVVDLARHEENTAQRLSAEPAVGDLPPIEAMSPAKELATILEQWRAVEKRLGEAQPGSAEAEELMLEFERQRDRYAVALKTRQQR